MEKLFTRHQRLGGYVALGGISLALLTGCGTGPNYSGDGNDFMVDGKVDHAGKQSLTVRVYDVEEDRGRANGWFDDDGLHQIHDNCNCHGVWNGNKKYGHVLSLSGAEISPSDVPEGACVAFTGKIRSNHVGKTWDDRPVYDLAKVVLCQGVQKPQEPQDSPSSTESQDTLEPEYLPS